MLLFRTLLTVLLYLCCISQSAGQLTTADCLKDNLTTASPDQLNKLTDKLRDFLPGKSFYIIGESHTFLANNDLQFALLKTLHQQGVYNVANELPHATCFLFNQYLETGDETILSGLRPEATYSLLKKVREFNLSFPKDQQIRYYGIDYADPKYNFYDLSASLQTIRKYVVPASLPLDTLIDHYRLKEVITLNDAKTLLAQLNDKLQTEEKQYRSHFGTYYDDLLLMSSNILGNRTNRDKSIFACFSLLYKLLQTKQKAPPKFLAFYGIGHLENLGTILQENDGSPVKGSVAKIGIQYINCWAGWTTPSQQTTGLYKGDKKAIAQLVSYCAAQPWHAALLNGNDCLNFKRGSSLDAVFIFNRYGDRKMNSWKFD